MTLKSSAASFTSTEGIRMPHKRQPRSTDYETPQCGLGKCTPSWMQCCANVICFTGTYALSGLVTSVLNIYISSQITTLERMFNMSSAVSGFILSCNDIGYLLTTLFMSYMARRTHIPRVLSLTTILYGVSGLVCVIPYFLTDVRLVAHSNVSASVTKGRNSANLCDPNVTVSAYAAAAVAGNVTSPPGGMSCGTEEEVMVSGMTPGMRQLAIGILAVGMAIQGVAKSPRYPFLATFIDDNVDKEKTTMYLGMITGIGIFGPVLAFTLGSAFSRVYVTLEETDMSQRDPRWIGAWWLGFLVFGLMGLIFGLPLLLFPRRFRRRRLEVENEKAVQGCGNHFKGFLQSMGRLLSTPIYVLTVLGICAMLCSTGGMISFGAKYLETMFSIPVWKANLIMGGLMVLAASIGSMVSGFVISKFRLTPVQCTHFLVIVIVINTVMTYTAVALGCDQPTMHLTSHTGSDEMTKYDFLRPSNTSCDVSCRCDDVGFFPVCGSDGLTYFSPCQAGCTRIKGQTYNCSCLSEGHSTARPGICPQDCPVFIPYLIVTVVGAFAATLGIMPGWVIYVRSVRETDKPMAIGFAAFMATLLGWFPGPVIAGKVVDTACLIWSKSCDGDGACLLYDLTSLRLRLNFLLAGLRSICFLCYFIVMLMAHCQKEPFFHHKEVKTLPAPEGEELMSEVPINGEKKVRMS